MRLKAPAAPVIFSCKQRQKKSGRYAPGAVSLLLILKIVWLIATEASDFQSVQPWQK